MRPKSGSDRFACFMGTICIWKKAAAGEEMLKKSTKTKQD